LEGGRETLELDEIPSRSLTTKPPRRHRAMRARRRAVRRGDPGRRAGSATGRGPRFGACRRNARRRRPHRDHGRHRACVQGPPRSRLRRGAGRTSAVGRSTPRKTGAPGDPGGLPPTEQIARARRRAPRAASRSGPAGSSPARSVSVVARPVRSAPSARCWNPRRARPCRARSARRRCGAVDAPFARHDLPREAPRSRTASSPPSSGRPATPRPASRRSRRRGRPLTIAAPRRSPVRLPRKRESLGQPERVGVLPLPPTTMLPTLSTRAGTRRGGEPARSRRNGSASAAAAPWRFAAGTSVARKRARCLGLRRRLARQDARWPGHPRRARSASSSCGPR